MNVTILEVVNGTDQEKATLAKGKDLVLKVVASPLFASKLLAASLTETNGLTNAEVLQKITAASLEVTLWMYSKWWSKVVGYTYFKTNTIYVNRKFFRGPVAEGSNLLHEMSHILGFAHEFVWETSVPYTLNRIFEECCVELNFQSS